MNRQSTWTCKRTWPRWLAGAMLLAAGAASAAYGQAPALPDFFVPPPVAPLDLGMPRPLPNQTHPVAKTTNYGAKTQDQGAQGKDPKEGDPKVIGPKEGVFTPGPPVLELAPAGPGCSKCANGRCVPGRTRDCSQDCHWCRQDTCWGRFLCELYKELCCPDPCYEGKWTGAANAAFFVEGARPVTQTRIRYDSVQDYLLPDRSEFFWARTGGGGKGPPLVENRVRTSELSLYQEVAAKGFSVFINIPYSSVDPEVNKHASGFTDMDVGTKSLLFDRDLLQITLMFRTYIPIGSPGKGLGTGHVSLEPSLLATLKCSPTTYIQGQLSEWIPLGGDKDYAGSVLHYHASVNQVLWSAAVDTQLIGTLEFSGYSFQDGAFTDPVLGAFQRSSGETYAYAGPGLRLVVCDWLDVGLGAAFAIGSHGAGHVCRTELRIRY